MPSKGFRGCSKTRGSLQTWGARSDLEPLTWNLQCWNPVTLDQIPWKLNPLGLPPQCWPTLSGDGFAVEAKLRPDCLIAWLPAYLCLDARQEDDPDDPGQARE